MSIRRWWTIRASRACARTWRRRTGNPFTCPSAPIATTQQILKSECIRCKTCGGYPCLLLAKSDARTIAIGPLLDLPNVTLLTGRKVKRLETDPSGKTITEVVCDVGGGEERWTGDIVVLAAGAVNTPAILLGSYNAAHPNGLANGSDQVGRNYMFHTLTAVVSITAAPAGLDLPQDPRRQRLLLGRSQAVATTSRWGISRRWNT